MGLRACADAVSRTTGCFVHHSVQTNLRRLSRPSGCRRDHLLELLSTRAEFLLYTSYGNYVANNKLRWSLFELEKLV